MKNLLCRAGAIALALIPSAALAQATIQAPANNGTTVPLHGTAYGPLNGPAVPVDDAHGLPVKVVGGAGSPDTAAAGSAALATPNAGFTVTPANGQSAGGVVITGLTGSGATLTSEGSYDGSSYVASPVVAVGAKVSSATITTDGQYRFNVTARRGFRFRVSSTGTGTATFAVTLSTAGFDPPAPTLDAAGTLFANISGTNGIALDTTLTTLSGKLGATTDPAATTTDGTATGLIAQTKQLVARVNALILALGSPVQAAATIPVGDGSGSAATSQYTNDTAGAATRGVDVDSATRYFDGTYKRRWTGNLTAPSVINRGGDLLATGQVSVGTTATLVAAARTGRQKITVSVGAANTCAFGNSGVTLTTGFPLQPTAGASLTLDTAAATYAVCSATTTISYVEPY